MRFMTAFLFLLFFKILIIKFDYAKNNILVFFKYAMKILNSKQKNVNFTSRNIYIRKADDIVRKVNCEFPMFSPTKALLSWKIMGNDNSGKNYTYKIFNQKFSKLFNKIRKSGELSNDNPCFLKTFENAQNYKIGNCREQSHITLGSLFANGYYKSMSIIPCINIDVVEKNTNKKVFEYCYPCDHIAILSKMGKEGKIPTTSCVILDGWLNKAMSYSEALNEYKQLFYARELPFAINFAKENLKNKQGSIRYFLNALFKKYTFKTHFTIGNDLSKDLFSLAQAKEIGETIAKKYPNVLVNK